MNTLTLPKARDQVAATIADMVRKAFGTKAMALPKGRGSERVAVGAVSETILHGLLETTRATDALRVLLEGLESNTKTYASLVASAKAKAAKPGEPKEWLKTEEAAKRMGFSRPYVAALFDAGEFSPDAIKSDSGHRRVRPAAVDKWMDAHGISVPLSPEHKALLDAPNALEFFQKSAPLSKKAESVLRKKVLAERAESIKHRPKGRQA